MLRSRRVCFRLPHLNFFRSCRRGASLVFLEFPTSRFGHWMSYFACAIKSSPSPEHSIFCCSFFSFQQFQRVRLTVTNGSQPTGERPEPALNFLSISMARCIAFFGGFFTNSLLPPSLNNTGWSELPAVGVLRRWSATCMRTASICFLILPATALLPLP